MINKVIREIDNQNRLQLPNDLMKHAKLKGEREVFLCSLGKSMLKLKKLKDLKNCKVIAKVKIDDKGRIVIPPEIRRDTQKFEIFVFDEYLILKEAHE